ncbi:MAG: hypothetical protein DRJ01_10660 [Bacteroidetes bacterium]|nr:MAG: hypothetical protein DRJ01_10660 [Bacteroidota bacterium]
MVKTMSKSVFAKEFYSVSSESLRRWIKGNSKLMSELKEIDYNSNSKLLKPREITLIRKYFG